MVLGNFFILRVGGVPNLKVKRAFLGNRVIMFILMILMLSNIIKVDRQRYILVDLMFMHSQNLTFLGLIKIIVQQLVLVSFFLLDRVE
jgi:hypothetical protein